MISLDSSGDSVWSRWSYQAGSPSLLLTCDSRTRITSLRTRSHELRTWNDPLQALAWLDDQCRALLDSSPSPLKTGWIGYLSYDLGRLFEPRVAEGAAVDDLHLPLFQFGYHHHVHAVDHLTGRSHEFRAPTSHSPIEFEPRYRVNPQALSCNFTQANYEQAVRRVLDYIAAGDVFQVNLAQRFSAGLPRVPAEIYADLRQRFGAWFGAFLDFGDHALLSNSPELFLRITPTPEGRRIQTRPIKGTRPRRPEMESRLADSEKDQAELNMIIDLERNDLGRICQIRSVAVTEPRTIEHHPTVLHGAATVSGLLRPEIGLVDILRATFPGGSVTGAPKIRAMQIIDELEPHRRGPYCGAIGYLSDDGHLQFNLAIRTIVATGDRVHVSVGGGIVADSVPEEEYAETLVKAQAMFEALSLLKKI